MAATLSRSFTSTRYVDLDAGSDAANGLTNSTPWRTLAKVTSAMFTGVPTGTPISVLVILAGTSGGTNGTSTGTDQFTFDALAAGRNNTTDVTEIGFRAWKTSDGARPASGVIARPALRADTPVTSLTQVGVTTVYKSQVLPVGTLLLGQVLFKPGFVGQLDADGAWKCHILITGQAAGVADATIAADLVIAGANTAYYKTDTRELFVNTSGLTTTAAHWSWCLDQSVANFSKIKPIGFTYVGVDSVDTAFGERGIAVFDSNVAEILNVRSYEHGVHGIICSYTNFQLKNILIDGCEVYGLGNSSTGNTMISAAGGSGNYDLNGVIIRNCKIRRYMLQNPSGARYTAAQYAIYFLGIATANGASYGFVKDALVSGCMLEDVSASKTSTVDASLCSFSRCSAPTDRTAFNSYPVRYENCYINTRGTWNDRSTIANQGSIAYAFSNCKVLCESPDTSLYTWGVRTCVIFTEPTDAAASNYVGVFGSTEWTLDIGLGDASNVLTGFGPKLSGTANQGIRTYFTARNAALTMVSKSASGQDTPLFEQNNDTDVADKDLLIDVQNGTCTYIYTPVVAGFIRGVLVIRDLPAAGNTSRVFLNNTYTGYRQDNFSAANATYAGFVTNVDPSAKLGTNYPYVTPNLAPSAPYIRRRPIIIAS